LSTHFSIEIDPCDVLGVSRQASLLEIRDAYRAKSKRYHPDAGGEEWAFRILVQAYEILSTARVVQATRREEAAPRRAPEPPPTARPWGPPPFSAGTGTSPPPRTERRKARRTDESGQSVRPGVRDQSADPGRVINVEKLTIRYEADQVWLITDRQTEHRLLSCCLNINWPDASLSLSPGSIDHAEQTLSALGEVFDAVVIQSRVQASRSAVVDGRFAGWLNYTTPDRAQAAVATLREMLHTKGLTVSQWSRDLVIPRHWR
jgi:hypothetical protein